MTNVLYQSYHLTRECPREVLTCFSLQAFKWIIMLSLPNCQLEKVVTATFVSTKGRRGYGTCFISSQQKRFSLRNRGLTRESQKGNPPKMFGQLVDQVLWQKKLQMPVWDAPAVDGGEHSESDLRPAQKARAFTQVCFSMAVGPCDDTSVRQQGVGPTDLQWPNGSWNTLGCFTAPKWDGHVCWACSSAHHLGSPRGQGLAAVPPEAVRSPAAAGSQDWLWLSFRGDPIFEQKVEDSPRR